MLSTKPRAARLKRGSKNGPEKAPCFVKTIFVCTVLCLVMALSARGREASPALESEAGFFEALADIQWECSFTAYPRVEFFPDRIDVLDRSGKVTRELSPVEVPEPGVIKLSFKSGASAWFVFAGDLQSFVIANMDKVYPFDTAGSAESTLPLGSEISELTLKLESHPAWQGLRVGADSVTPIGESAGDALAATPYLPHALGVFSPAKGASLVLLSRQRQGGWWMEGKHLGTGSRTSRSGVFKPPAKTLLKDYSLRSTQFSYALLRAGREMEAAAQEQYAARMIAGLYGESSEKVIHGYREMGDVRGYTRSYQRAPEWHAKAYNLAKQHLSDQPGELFDYGTRYAGSLADRGDFEPAKLVLQEIYGYLEQVGYEGKTAINLVNRYYETMGEIEFGLRSYDRSAKIFLTNAERALEVNYASTAVRFYLHAVACQLAAGQRETATATLQRAIDLQRQRQKDNPKSKYDTYRLAFACVAMRQFDVALEFAPVSSRRSSVLYEEYARLLALWNSGDREAASEFAREIGGRFDELSDIQIRRDIDAMTVELTVALSDPSPERARTFEQAWADQAENLRKRPLQNYLFARVIVDVIAGLKQVR